MNVVNGQKEMVADICVFNLTNSLEKHGIILHWIYRKNLKNKRALDAIYKINCLRIWEMHDLLPERFRFVLPTVQGKA